MKLKLLGIIALSVISNVCIAQQDVVINESFGSASRQSFALKSDNKMFLCDSIVSVNEITQDIFGKDIFSNYKKVIFTYDQNDLKKTESTYLWEKSSSLWKISSYTEYFNNKDMKTDSCYEYLYENGQRKLSYRQISSFNSIGNYSSLTQINSSKDTIARLEYYYNEEGLKDSVVYFYPWEGRLVEWYLDRYNYDKFGNDTMINKYTNTGNGLEFWDSYIKKTNRNFNINNTVRSESSLNRVTKIISAKEYFYSIEYPTILTDIEYYSYENSVKKRSQLDFYYYPFNEFTSSIEVNHGIVTVYPTLCAFVLFIERNTSEPSHYNIYSATGVLMMSGELTERLSSVHISSLPLGTYFVQIKTNMDIYSTIIIKN